jgi:mannose-6-phosphate isomerase-like protein (cupin superfamily)
MKSRLTSLVLTAVTFSALGFAGSKVFAEAPAVAPPGAPAVAAPGAPAAAGAYVRPAGAVEPEPRYSLDNTANTFTMGKTEKTKVGYVYWFFDKQIAGGKTLKLSVVGPHQASHDPHFHVEDEFFYVVEGKAEFFLDGKRKVVGPNTGMFAPSNVMHGIKNAGDTELKYLVIKEYANTK